MSQDTLSDLLRSVHLRGVLFFHVDCVEEPWVVEAPMASMIKSAIMPDSEHLMEYHVLIQGSCWAGVVGDIPVEMHQGDVIVFPHGDAHVVSSIPGLRAEPDIDFYAQARPPQLPFMLNQNKGSANSPKVLQPFQTNILCGFFGCDSRPFNPLLASLPKMIHMRASDINTDNWIANFSNLAKAESTGKRPGGEAVLERMSEMMFIDLLRDYLEKLPDEHSSWLAGLRDRYIGRVLSLIHEQPAKEWTLDQMASKVGLSRSAFHERFVRFIGLTPIQYLSNWRMQIASRLLTQSNATIASVAVEIGYDSEAAFSRAFKRLLGVPPSVWRRQRESVANFKKLVGIND